MAIIEPEKLLSGGITVAFYDLSSEERKRKCSDIEAEIKYGLETGDSIRTLSYFCDTDTYIRKAAYLSVGRTYKAYANLRRSIISMLENLMNEPNPYIRQTVINCCGEIAVFEFNAIAHIFEIGLSDERHEVKNAVQGSLKKAGDKNSKEVIPFCQKFILHENPEIRRQVLHGLELRGRKHPEDILPVLRLLQFENHKRVRPMLIHVFGQISYKEGCLEKVTRELANWEDKTLISACIDEILDQNRHANSHFKTIAVTSPEECRAIIDKYLMRDGTECKI